MKVIPTPAGYPDISTDRSASAHSLRIGEEQVLPIMGRIWVDMKKVTLTVGRSGRVWLDPFTVSTPKFVDENHRILIVDSRLSVENHHGQFKVLPTDSDNYVIVYPVAGIKEMMFLNPDTNEFYLHNLASEETTLIENLDAYDERLTLYNPSETWDHPIPAWNKSDRIYTFAVDSFIPVVDLLN